MPKYLDPKADLTFKKIFGQHKHLVMSLLNALLPLPDGMEIKSVEYMPSENIPDNPGKKYSIVDVYCTDNLDRSFIVEMQSVWNTEFFVRTLFNVASVYTKQLEKGMSFGDLKDVYALCLVNDKKAFEQYGGNEYIQEYYLTNKNHPKDDRRTDLSMVFVVLPNFKPQNRAVKKMHDLWLKFLTEIDENTIDADPELIENEETKEALDLLRTSAFTDGEMLAYEKYWLDVSTEKSALEKERKEGRAEGHAEGRAEGIAEGIAEGEKQTKISMAHLMKANHEPIDKIIMYSGLTAD
ncbi:MAG: Rpn family recombination-promoting nuclease/putative transposase [Bacteroidales bacterium]|nr:Rpn family recombination-promoting nuclease/putative transposase [Bacteroidales bacterium]